MSELTNIHARSVKDLTTPTELPVDPDTLDQVKLVAGNFPMEYAGNEALTVKQIKDVAAADLERKVNASLSNLSTTANKFYPTLSEANSHLATMSVNDVVTIGEEAHKGLWYKATANAKTLTKSVYDPLTQANNYTNNKVIEAKNYTDLVFDAVPAVIAPYVAQAEAAATAATISAGVFETPEAGVDPTTGVEDGEYFNVRSPSSDSYIDEYQNIDGVATPSGKTYPSGAYVQNIVKYTALPFVEGKTYSLNERVQLTNGDIVKSTIVGNVNDPNVDMMGWVNINSASQIVDASGKSQQEVNDGINSITDLLAIQNPKNGTRMFVKSYNAPNYALENPFAGGGTFIYNESKESINDGVTIFNGWMRDLSDKVLTTEDAGLVAGDGADATAKIKAIVAALKDGFTFKIIGEHCVTSQINIKNRKGLTIDGGGTLDAKTLRASFVFEQDTDYQVGRGNLGIISMYNCHHIDISNVKIRGCKKNTELEWGDCAVRYERCSFVSIHDNDFRGFAGWGIFGFRSDDCNTYNNHIEDVSRQAGIDIFYGGNRNNAYSNTVINCGLYGIEVETGVNVDNGTTVGNSCYDNTVVNCKFGITIAGKQSRASVHSNTIDKCLVGVTCIYATYENSVEGVLSNYILDNTITNCYVGGMINASKNVQLSKNTIHVDALPSYFIRDQYFSTMFISETDRKIFWTMYTDKYKVGDVIKIRNGVYTIVSMTPDESVNPYGDLTYKKVTLDAPLSADVEQNDNIMLSAASGGFTNAVGIATRFMDSGSGVTYKDINDKIIVSGNIISGDIYTAIHQNSDFDSSFTKPRESFIGNTIATSKVGGRALRLARASKATLVGGNTIVSDESIANLIAESGGDTTNIKPSEIVIISCDNGIASGSVGKSHYYNNTSPRVLTSVTLILENWKSTADVKLILGDTNNPLTITANPVTQNVTYKTVNTAVGSITGLNRARIETAGNVANIGSYRIELGFM